MTQDSCFDTLRKQEPVRTLQTFYLHVQLINFILSMARGRNLPGYKSKRNCSKSHNQTIASRQCSSTRETQYAILYWSIHSFLVSARLICPLWQLFQEAGKNPPSKDSSHSFHTSRWQYMLIVLIFKCQKTKVSNRDFSHSASLATLTNYDQYCISHKLFNHTNIFWIYFLRWLTI